MHTNNFLQNYSKQFKSSIKSFDEIFIDLNINLLPPTHVRRKIYYLIFYAGNTCLLLIF